MDTDEKFLARSTLVKGHVDALVTVATAVLVLSVTVLKEVRITNPDAQRLLNYSWVLFTGAIVAGVVHNYVLMHLVKRDQCWSNNNCWHRTFLTIFIVCLHLTFLAAATIFLIFALNYIK
jgi:hypothetical protein